MNWPTAFVLTQIVEIPVYLYAGRNLASGKRWLLAAGASTVTHPVVWFAFPWESTSWELCFVFAETFAVVAEAVIGKIVGLKRPWLWSLAANGASVGVGLFVQSW